MPDERSALPPHPYTHVVMQPTTGCNLNCTYCYLPGRDKYRRMRPEVAVAVATAVRTAPHQITILWHGGEPLSCGIGLFRELLEPFRELRTEGRIQHSVQTNATLINDEWCGLFKEEGVSVGVSLDGYEKQNTSRVNWADGPSFSEAMRGIEALKRHGIEFGVIAVVNQHNISDPEGFYQFFLSLGCSQLNVNVEEKEGLNRNASSLMDEKVRHFWRGLFSAWRKQPQLRIREFDEVLGWMGTVAGSRMTPREIRRPNMWPTVSVDGEVVILSPELMAGTGEEHQRFGVGNVLAGPLDEIVTKGIHRDYVQEAFAGFRKCRAICSYYSYCGGGEASNKYFELGTMDATETAHCRHTRKAVVDVVMAEVGALKSLSPSGRRKPT